MQPTLRLNRRAFLQAALAAATAAGTGIACTRNSSPWRFFTIDEARTLASMVDQIIPPDQDAGAVWAGVVNYIDRQLCGPFQDLQGTYRQGLAALDQSSRSRYNHIFPDLSSDQQIEMLRLISGNRALGNAWSLTSPGGFFQTVVDHSMQGFYGDPRHGGNREGASWKMLGLSYPPIRGRLRTDLAKSRSS
jgi:gluconate 2-dehydrogenase gamma chain